MYKELEQNGRSVFTIIIVYSMENENNEKLHS